MLKPRYSFFTDWPFYILIFSYAYLILNMTYGLWFGDGINIFASYSDAADPTQAIVDANKVYWSKTCFLFGILLLMGLNFDFRAAAGLAALFWAGSLIVNFGPTFVLLSTLAIGVLLVGLQIYRRQIFSQSN